MYKQIVLEKNIKLIDLGLAFGTFGNCSLKLNDRLIIKPSGVNLYEINENQMSVVSLNEGKLLEGINPSSDTPTHLNLYRNFGNIGGIVHTHSTYATAWAQAMKPIPCLGTTHADYWIGDIPLTRNLTKKEIDGNYEEVTGKVIVETLEKLGLDPLDCPGILVARHGPFTWGATLEDAVKNAELLEYIAKIALQTIRIDQNSEKIFPPLHDRHFSRKHGPNAYYGQIKQ